MNRSEKEQIIAAVKQRAERAKSFADFTGITVEQVSAPPGIPVERQYRSSRTIWRGRSGGDGRLRYGGTLHEPTAIAFGFTTGRAGKDHPEVPEKNDKLRVKVCVLETVP